MRRTIAVLGVLVALIGGVAAQRAPDTARMTTTCPAFDLTGRVLVNVIVSVGETICVYKRPKMADECPTHTPLGWTVVGKVDAPKNKDKVRCVYWNWTGG